MHGRDCRGGVAVAGGANQKASLSLAMGLSKKHAASNEGESRNPGKPR